MVLRRPERADARNRLAVRGCCSVSWLSRHGTARAWSPSSHRDVRRPYDRIEGSESPYWSVRLIGAITPGNFPVLLRGTGFVTNVRKSGKQLMWLAFQRKIGKLQHMILIDTTDAAA